MGLLLQSIDTTNSDNAIAVFYSTGMSLFFQAYRFDNVRNPHDRRMWKILLVSATYDGMRTWMTLALAFSAKARPLQLPIIIRIALCIIAIIGTIPWTKQSATWIAS